MTPIVTAAFCHCKLVQLIVLSTTTTSACSRCNWLAFGCAAERVCMSICLSVWSGQPPALDPCVKLPCQFIAGLTSYIAASLVLSGNRSYSIDHRPPPTFISHRDTWRQSRRPSFRADKIVSRPTAADRRTDRMTDRGYIK